MKDITVSINGISVKLTDDQVWALTRLAGSKNVVQLMFELMGAQLAGISKQQHEEQDRVDFEAFKAAN